jgi:GPH family glycoside/pentoside/hexuronide:cation symporter
MARLPPDVPVDGDSLPRRTILTYAAPSAGTGLAFMLILIYLMKFSTDVLLIAPGAIGAIFGLSRIWDAVSDPLAGFLSDRTRTRLGRRRPWMLAATLPFAIFFVMAWSPPLSLQGSELVAWMAIAVFGLFTAITIFNVPHTSLGAELTPSYHERNRVFGLRNASWGIGSMLSFGALYLLSTAGEDERTVASQLAVGIAICGAAAMLVPVIGLRERALGSVRGPSNPLRAVADVGRNPHARLLLLVFFIENTGTGAMAVLAPYVLEYIVEAPDKLALFFPFYFVPMIASIPLWIRAGRRFEKKWLWVFSMSLSGLAFGGFFFVSPERIPMLCALGAVAGFAGGCSQMVSPSIQADVVDWDELRTGERKEGMYFATWNLVQKSSGGVVAMLAGFALQYVGFEPNVPQNESVKFAMLALFGILPFACYAAGVVLLLRFQLTSHEHARIRAALEARRS